MGTKSKSLTENIWPFVSIDQNIFTIPSMTSQFPINLFSQETVFINNNISRSLFY